LLGTIHQNAATPDPVLKLLHSAAMRIGDPRRKFPDVGVFGDWLTEYQRAGPGRGLGAIRTQLIATTPPGAAKMLTDAFAKFDEDLQVEWPPDVVRGLAKFQVSSVNITVPAGSSSEVTVHARIRAHYYPDPDTTILPAPVHGDLHDCFIAAGKWIGHGLSDLDLFDEENLVYNRKTGSVPVSSFCGRRFVISACLGAQHVVHGFDSGRKSSTEIDGYEQRLLRIELVADGRKRQRVVCRHHHCGADKCKIGIGVVWIFSRCGIRF